MTIEEFYRDNYRIVYGYLLSLSGNAAVAEELASETFLRAAKTPARPRRLQALHLALRHRKKSVFQRTPASKTARPFPGGSAAGHRPI